MNETIIDRHNSVVKPEDTVYNLGDLFLKMNANEAKAIWRRLNGHKYVIKGNHDKIAEQIKNDFLFFKEYHELTIGKQGIVLFHYPLRTWNHSHHGSYNLYGHVHGALPDDPRLLSIDVGVDSHNFYPINFDQVTSIMNKRKANGAGPIAGDR